VKLRAAQQVQVSMTGNHQRTSGLLTTCARLQAEAQVDWCRLYHWGQHLQPLSVRTMLRCPRQPSPADL
jgi:hypothetical protein